MPDSSRWTNGGGDPSLNEINRADRFFEALAAKQPAYPTDHAEAELAFLFAGLRDDVRDAPVTTPVSLSDAVEALNGGMAKNRSPRRHLAVVGSVAAAMLCIGGFGTAVYGAGPGDGLYGMRTALFGQHEQTRDDQVSLASAQLQQVQQLIDNGQWEEAQSKLVAVSTTVQDVGQVEQKQQLVEQWNALTYKVVEQDPAATLAPGEPLPALPESPLTWLPVPVVETTTPSSDTTTSESATTSPTSTDTTVTSPSDTALPPGSTTPPSDESSPSSPTSSSTASPTATSVPSTSASPVAEPAPASSTPPSTTTAPSSTTVVSSTAPATTTSTTVTRQPAPSQQSPPPSPAASPPAERPTSTVAELPAVPPRVAPTPAPAATAPVQPSPPATSTPPAAATPTTTTTVVPPA
jgi:anti-sigma-D factor RsdA-like protein